MPSRGACFLVLCCHLVSVVLGGYAPPNPGAGHKRIDKLDPKPGTFVNCGNASTEARLTWTPSKLQFGDTVQVDFHVIPKEDLSRGYLQAWVYLHGQTDPIYYTGMGSAFNCQDIHLYAQFITCPFSKDKPVNVKDFKLFLAPSMGLPTGNYNIKLQLLNLNQKELFCLYGNIVILDD